MKVLAVLSLLLITTPIQAAQVGFHDNCETSEECCEEECFVIEPEGEEAIAGGGFPLAGLGALAPIGTVPFFLDGGRKPTEVVRTGKNVPELSDWANMLTLIPTLLTIGWLWGRKKQGM